MSAATTSLHDVFEHCRILDGSLTERLAIFANAARTMEPSFSEAVDRLVARLRQTDAGENAPKIGETMPPFLLPNETGCLVGLEEILGKGPVAVTFHRGHWCPYCRINIHALAGAHRDIAPAGGQIVAIMPERQQYAVEFKSDAHADFPILTDMDNGYAMSLGLAYWLGEEMKAMLGDRIGDIAAFQGNEMWTLPIPATFVVGRDGKITARFIDPDFRKRMAIDELLAALRAAV
jgi:peroxiredoxin